MAETEKVSMNMNVVDLGHIDLLVEKGFYSSRTDFLRTAIRNLLATHSDTVKETVVARAFTVGVNVYSRQDLEKYRDAGKQLTIHVIGLLVIDSSVSPELALATIHSLKVYGVFRASEAVKAALAAPMSPDGSA
ncbi:MAG: hypothetical protein JWL77_767 [Chthonomonadaceae bacterium]|nr:hypothetical protein [Chthonomonadaceae bacterium]